MQLESWEQVVNRVISHQRWLWERALGRTLHENQEDELEEDDEEEEDMDSEEEEEEEEDDDEIEKHRKELEQLENDDPEFYKMLKEEGGDLLHFGKESNEDSQFMDDYDAEENDDAEDDRK